MRRYLLAILLLTTGCSTLDIKKDKLSGVKRAAIVGFGVKQEMPANIGDVFFKKPKDSGPFSGSHAAGIESSEHVDQMYKSLSTKLKSEMKWEVTEIDKVRTNARYIQEFKEETEGWQNRPIINEQYKIFAPAGVMDDFSFNRLDQARRDELMKQLQVQALVTVDMDIDLEKGGGLKKLVGAVEYSPKSRLMFRVYIPGEGQPVWRDTWAVGEATSQSSTNVMGIGNAQKLTELVVLSADSAFDQVFEHYRK